MVSDVQGSHSPARSGATDLVRRYRKLARKWHPDKWGTAPAAEREHAEEQFKRLVAA